MQLKTSKNKKKRKKRACNIIIHGKIENDLKEDESFVSNLILKIAENISLKSISRIGRHKHGKKRPIKVELHKIEDKEIIITNLRKLKGYKEYQGISVTMDYTISERETIRKQKYEAHIKNLSEPPNSNFVWKIRGTPKSGIFIKRFCKIDDKQDKIENNSISQAVQ